MISKENPFLFLTPLLCLTRIWKKVPETYFQFNTRGFHPIGVNLLWGRIRHTKTYSTTLKDTEVNIYHIIMDQVP